MKPKGQQFSYVNQVIILALAALVLSTVGGSGLGCANIVPPTGGPRDSLPPLLLGVTPADSTRNFKGNRVVLNFDEYVQVENIQKNLLVSPVPKVNPFVQVKLRSITIDIKDTLEENTTYSFNFGDAIKDLNEGNILKEYTYLFSTGPTLDSLSLGGKLLIAETGKADSTLIVMLHTSLADSAVAKENPRYIARVDREGVFRFNNLAPGTYAIYALKDEGGRRYQSKTELFAFGDSAVTSQSQRKDIMLFAFTEPDTAKPKTTAAPARSPKSKSDEPDRYMRIQSSAAGGAFDLLSDVEINVGPDPIRSFDSTKILVTDTAYVPVKGYTAALDTSGKRIIVRYPWAENARYNVLIDSTFAIDTSGRRIPGNDTIAIQTKKASEYGLVRLRFINLELARNPVLQFVQGDQVKHSHVFTNNQFFAELFYPGEYDLRLVFDENKNGLWDTGRFFGGRRQPERVQLISRKVTVKANWDNEIDIQL